MSAFQYHYRGDIFSLRVFTIQTLHNNQSLHLTPNANGKLVMRFAKGKWNGAKRCLVTSGSFAPQINYGKFVNCKPAKL